MKKKIVVLMLSAAMTMSMMTGCGNTAKDDSASTTTETTKDAEATEEAEPTEEATEEAVLLEEEPQAARTPAALTAAMAVINERREIFFMENSFNKQIVLCLWRLVINNQLPSSLSDSFSFVGCYGNGSEISFKISENA